MTQQSKIRLLIADDHEVLRSGVKAMLAGTEIKVVAEVATGQAAVKYALEHEVDVVLMDVRMPDGDGVTALGRIKLDKPNLPILMFSGYDNPTYGADEPADCRGAAHQL
jgi:DNA-binding NarL/FixJ family response regulator